LKAFCLAHGSTGGGIAIINTLTSSETPFLENPHEGFARLTEEVLLLLKVKQEIFIIESKEVIEFGLLPNSVSAKKEV